MNLTFGGDPINLIGTPTKVGDKIADFSLTDGDFGNKTLSDFSGKKIFSIVPSIDTKTCEMQTVRFNTEAELLNIPVITVSMDLPPAQARFCGSFNTKTTTLLSDYKTQEFGKNYGLLLEGFHLLTRAIIVVNDDNVVTYIEYIQELSNEPDYKSAIAAYQAI